MPMMIKPPISIAFILFSFQAVAQVVGSETIDASTVKPWESKAIAEYEGVYHFGDSEDESDLLVIVSQGKAYVQIRTGSWAPDGKTWVWKYENLVDVIIEGNKFQSDKSSGEFVTYGNDNIKGLKIGKPWSTAPESGQYEIGKKTGTPTTYLSGNFTQASMRILDKKELGKLSKRDLKLMRNEIFARYGLKFKSGGEMDTYFRKQSWYTAHYDNVDMFLTELEKENVKLIQVREGK